MDSLLANYASSDDDADETLAPRPAAPAASRLEEASTKPSSTTSSSGLFSSIPAPKSTTIFSSLPPPKSNPIFSSLPPPKSSASTSCNASSTPSGNPKRVVQFRPPLIRPAAGDSSDEEDEAKKRRPSTGEAPPASSASGPVSSFLPPPKHSLGLGSGAGAARRSAIDTAPPERSSLGSDGTWGPAVDTAAPEKSTIASADAEDSEEGTDKEEDDMPAPELQQEQQSYDAATGQQEQQSSEATTGQQEQQGYAAGAASSNGYEGYSWDPNYYANYGANYGWNPSGDVSYGSGEYPAFGGEHSGGHGHAAPAAYGGDYAGGYGQETEATVKMQEPALPPEVGRIGGKRGRNEMPTEIMEVNQAELMKNRPRQDKSKLTGMAFGPSYQPVSSAKGKPSKLHKRKHQIGSLYYDMKQKEMELAERRAKGILTKAETQGKYGW